MAVLPYQAHQVRGLQIVPGTAVLSSVAGKAWEQKVPTSVPSAPNFTQHVPGPASEAQQSSPGPQGVRQEVLDSHLIISLRACTKSMVQAPRAQARELLVRDRWLLQDNIAGACSHETCTEPHESDWHETPQLCL